MTRTPLLVLVLGATACVSPAPVGATREAIVGGTPTTGDESVVLLRARLANNRGIVDCTGEIVSPHVVMTAAHCVDPSVVGDVTSFDVFFGSDVNGVGDLADQWIHVTETRFDPIFSALNADGGHDIAVAVLASPSPSPSLPLNRVALTTAQVGAQLRIVGFGATVGNSPATGNTVGVKEQAETTLTRFDPLLVQLGNATSNICDGDSGGPAFLIVDGVEVIAAVASFGDPSCRVTSDATRVDTVAVAFVDPLISLFDSIDYSADGSVLPDGGATVGTPGSRGIANVGGAELQPIPKSGCAMGGAASPSLLGFAVVLLVSAAFRRKHERSSVAFSAAHARSERGSALCVRDRPSEDVRRDQRD